MTTDHTGNSEETKQQSIRLVRTAPLPEERLTKANEIEIVLLLELALQQLRVLLVLLAAITYERGGNGQYVGAEALEAMNTARRKEADARIENERWGITNSGQMPSPANVPALSAAAQIPDKLNTLNQELVRAFQRAGEFLPVHLRDRPTAHQVLDEVSQLAAHAPRKWLEQALRTAQSLAVQAENVTLGNAIARHRDPCPFCGRRTLVVHLEDGYTECGADPQTGHLRECLCGDAYCDCRKPGLNFRHRWWRDRVTAMRRQYRSKVVADRWTYKTLLRLQKSAADRRAAQAAADKTSQPTSKEND